MGAVIAAILLMGGCGSESPPSPAEALAEIQAYLEDDHPVRVEGTIEVSEGTPDQDTPPAVQRTRVSGVIDFPDRGQWALQTESDRFEANFMTQEFGSTDHELVAVPGGGYVREGVGAALETLPWEFTEVPDADGLTSVGTTFVAHVGLLPFGFPGFEPDGLRTLIGALSDPEQPEPGVYRGKLTLEAFTGDPSINEQFPSGAATAELTVDGDGRLERAVWRAVAREPEGTEYFGWADVEVVIDMAFSRWGEPVQIDVPSGDEVDELPLIDETALAQWKEAPLLVPRIMEAGWTLTSAGFDDEESQLCPTIFFAYQAPDPTEEFPVDAVPDDIPFRHYLDLYERAAACDAGAGYVAEVPEGVVEIVLTNGATRVRVLSSLPRPEVEFLLAELVPFDLEYAPVDSSGPPAGE